MQAFQNEHKNDANDNTNQNEQMGKRMRELREKQGYTQIQFSSYLSISEQTYGRYERGACGIPLDILITLHKEYKIDLNYLICGDAPSSNDTTRLIIKDLEKLLNKYNLS